MVIRITPSRLMKFAAVKSRKGMSDTKSSNTSSPQSHSWGPTAIAAGILSIVGMGDALIYVVLPVNAETFGVSLFWVGVLLAANRLIRIVGYGPIASVTQRYGPRKIAIVAATTAAASTFMYWLFTGGWLLLGARILWGLSFAALSLAAYAYAISHTAKAGSRVGVSWSIRQIGPGFALLIGSWLAGVLGPRDVFFVLGILALPGILLATALPKEESRSEPKKGQWLPKPLPYDLFFFIVGFAVDGFFAMTITIILAKTTTLGAAMLAGGVILSIRRFTEVLLAPLGGWFGDRYGTDRMLFVFTIIVAAGFAILSLDYVYIGAGAIIVGRAVLAAIGPAEVAHRHSKDTTLHRIAVMQTWRDFGAAVGPLMAGLLLAQVSMQWLNGGIAVIIALGVFLQRRP
jgi:DHA1 family inner membrane transport protein